MSWNQISSRWTRLSNEHGSWFPGFVVEIHATATLECLQAPSYANKWDAWTKPGTAIIESEIMGCNKCTQEAYHFTAYRLKWSDLDGRISGRRFVQNLKNLDSERNHSWRKQHPPILQAANHGTLITAGTGSSQAWLQSKIVIRCG